MYIYTASQDAQSISTAVDLFFFTLADDKIFKMLQLDLANTSDLGDANEEVLKLGFYSGVTSGGGGSALSEIAIDDYNSITAGTAVVGQGTASTGGTLRKVFYWNIRQAGPVWIATPETKIVARQATGTCAIRLLAAPADAVTVSAEVMWEEV